SSPIVSSGSAVACRTADGAARAPCGTFPERGADAHRNAAFQIHVAAGRDVRGSAVLPRAARPGLRGHAPPSHRPRSPRNTSMLIIRAYPTRRCDAGSFLKDLLPPDRCPHAAGRWRGGDGEWATCTTTGDDLAHSGGAVGVGEGGAAGARIAPHRR